MMRRTMMGLAMAAAFGIGGGAASAGTVYGIDNAGRVLKVDTAAPHNESVLYTPSPAASNGNGVALDLAGGRLLFRQPSSGGDLYSLDLSTNAVTTIKNSGGVNDLVLAGESSNAAFHNGAYWYIRENSDDLYRVTLTGNTGVATKVADITGNTVSLGFGDIAFDAQGVMYGSSNAGFFSLDLSSSTTWNRITTTPTLYQIAFVGSTLLGHSASTGQWYTIDKTTGIATATAGFDTTPLRDIAGTVPEPSSVAMMGLGMASALAFARRRMKARA